MPPDANSVNITRRYHHGALRDAVIGAALARLEDAPGEALSLREIGRDIGVSATAIYRHFPSKDALLDALAGEAAARLAERQRAASERAGGGVAGFTECGREYVRFALAAPALFRLMSVRGGGDPLTAPLDSLNAALRFLRESIAALLPDEVPAARRAAVALHAWALVHGLAQLMLDGLVPRDPAMIDAVVDARTFVGAAGD